MIHFVVVQIGWALGPEPLVTALWRVLQYVTFCVSTPLQAAVAAGKLTVSLHFPRVIF